MILQNSVVLTLAHCRYFTRVMNQWISMPNLLQMIFLTQEQMRPVMTSISKDMFVIICILRIVGIYILKAIAVMVKAGLVPDIEYNIPVLWHMQNFAFEWWVQSNRLLMLEELSPFLL